MKQDKARHDGAIERAPYAPWRPETIVEAATPDGRSALQALVAGFVGDFLAIELGVKAPPVSSDSDCETLSASTAIDGFDEAIACTASRSSILALCAAAFGAPAHVAEGWTQGGAISEKLAAQTIDGLLDQFCKAASASKGIEIKRADASAQRSTTSEQSLRNHETLPVAVAAFGLELQYRMSTGDARRLIAEAPQRAQSRQPGSGASEFSNDLGATEVTMAAIVEDRPVTVEELREWKVGSMVALASTPRSMCRLYVQGLALFECEIVRQDGFFAVRLAGDGKSNGGAEFGRS